MFMPFDFIISLLRISPQEMVVTGNDKKKKGDILHRKVFIHRFIWNKEPGIIPITNNKEMVN